MSEQNEVPEMDGQLPDVDIGDLGNDKELIKAKAEFLKTYAESQKTVIEAQTSREASILKLKANQEAATASAVLGLFTNSPVADFLRAKTGQLTQEHDLAIKKLELDSVAAERRDKSLADIQKRKDYLRIATYAGLFIGIAVFGLVVTYLVTKEVISPAAVAVVVSNLASAAAGMLAGRRAGASERPPAGR